MFRGWATYGIFKRTGLINQKAKMLHLQQSINRKQSKKGSKRGRSLIAGGPPCRRVPVMNTLSAQEEPGRVPGNPLSRCHGPAGALPWAVVRADEAWGSAQGRSVRGLAMARGGCLGAVRARHSSSQCRKARENFIIALSWRVRRASTGASTLLADVALFHVRRTTQLELFGECQIRRTHRQLDAAPAGHERLNYGCNLEFP
jgi:hypothetical protein